MPATACTRPPGMALAVPPSAAAAGGGSSASTLLTNTACSLGSCRSSACATARSTISWNSLLILREPFLSQPLERYLFDRKDTALIADYRGTFTPSAGNRSTLFDLVRRHPISYPSQ